MIKILKADNRKSFIIFIANIEKNKLHFWTKIEFLLNTFVAD